MATIPHVVIVGAGFGGLEAARRLANSPLRITLIDRHNYHLFQPLLYQVAIAGLSPVEIAYPVRSIFRRQRNLTFVMAEVAGVDLDARQVRTDHETFDYDTLILAVGSRTNFFGMKAIQDHGLQVKDIAGAVEIRNHLLRMCERASREKDGSIRRQLLTFVIVGGGPTGVETAGALAELIRLVLKRDDPRLNLDEVRVLLLEAGDTLVPTFPASLRKATEAMLCRKGVEVRLNAKVSAYQDDRVVLEDGTAISTRSLVWTAGARAEDLIDRLGIPQAVAGRASVDPFLRLPGHPEVFVIGDAACVMDGNASLPMLATVAAQEARSVVGNIRRSLAGRAGIPFRYRDPGLLATIGRNAAVADIAGLKLKGFPAWIVWVGLHIFRIIGFRNRLVVMINWAWDYFLYDRAVRLITLE